MRTLLVATGAAVVAGALAGSCTRPPLARPSGEFWPGVMVAANTDAHVPGSVAARDRSPAQCVAVRVGAGQVVLRLRDPESGIRGFRGTPLGNAVLTPSGKSLPRPVAQSDVRVSRPMGWLQGGVVISHVNGAGIAGSCVVTSAPDGWLRTITSHRPRQVASP